MLVVGAVALASGSISLGAAALHVKRGASGQGMRAELIDVKEGTSLWAGRWDVSWTDIFTVQDAIATEVAGALAVQLGADEQQRLRHHPTNLAAYDAYLHGEAISNGLTTTGVTMKRASPRPARTSPACTSWRAHSPDRNIAATYTPAATSARRATGTPPSGRRRRQKASSAPATRMA